MREAFFILLVIGVLLGLTAIRYRKQIVGMIRIGRMLKTGRMPAGSGERQIRNEGPMPLVNCAKCSVWVPQFKAIKVGDKFYCSAECLQKVRA